ncbi:hypothetical protein KAI87_07750, partial [Myxococcota bacterium]|nr:hypothetical protein [Myxococcota bacterium]
MSEYQYYEFRAIDQPLSEKEMEELRQYSSRAEITPGSFTNVYHYGNFGGKPEKLVAQYFDAFLYLANWGTRKLIFRVPEKLFDLTHLNKYTTGEYFDFQEHGDNITLSFYSGQEDNNGWEEGEGWLASLVHVRAGLLRGDDRALYLSWLLGVANGEIDGDEKEPPLPPGLGELDASHQALAEFLRVDPDLITAAAELSPKMPNKSLSKPEFDTWLSGLSEKKKDELLSTMLTDDDPHIFHMIRAESLSAARSPEPQPITSARSANDLIARSEILMKERRRQEATERARKKAEEERQSAKIKEIYIKSLVGREEELWMTLRKFIKKGQG